MDCIPPWLSSKEQCYKNMTTYNYTSRDIQNIIYKRFIRLKHLRRLTVAEKNCKNPCIKMTNIISKRAEFANAGTGLEIRFKKTVKVEKKIVSYTGFNFIIDIGSSLGLWLGLSALGITDLAINAFMIGKNWL